MSSISVGLRIQVWFGKASRFFTVGFKKGQVTTWRNFVKRFYCLYSEKVRTTVSVYVILCAFVYTFHTTTVTVFGFLERFIAFTILPILALGTVTFVTVSSSTGRDLFTLEATCLVHLVITDRGVSKMFGRSDLVRLYDTDVSAVETR